MSSDAQQPPKTLGRKWAGHVFGTNTGKLFVELESGPAGIQGLLRFMDDQLGLVLYDVAGRFDGSRLTLAGTPNQANPGVEMGNLEVVGDLGADGTFRGDWKSTVGTAGTFNLFPHDATPATSPGLSPEQLHTATRTLGAVRLYADDVRELVQFLGKDFRNPRVIVTYRDRGIEIVRYAEDFMADARRLGSLLYLRLQLSEPEAHGLNRNASVELDASGTNEIRVQGIQESWVLGKAEALAAHLRRRQKPLATSFRRFGLNLNTLILFAALVALPDLPLFGRILFLLFVAAVIAGIVQVHARLIPNAMIFLGEVTPGPLARSWPQVASWFLAIAGAVAASIVYGALAGEIEPRIPAWLIRMIS